MTNDIMRSVQVNNKEVLAVLNKFVDLWYNDLENFQKNIPLSSKEKIPEREYYIGEKHKNKIINMGRGHAGYPEAYVGLNLKRVVEGSEPDKQLPVNQYTLAGKENNFYFQKKYIELNAELSALLGTRVNALCGVYPPGGFISWHNNANATSYNVIFTWSENGNGYWKHVDPYTNEEVTVPDVPGWQCKSFYFGSYEDDPKDLVYHTASTDCWRMTISYVFDRQHEAYWKDCIDEIEYND